MRYPTNYIAVSLSFNKVTHKGVDFGWNNSYGGKNIPIYAVDDGVVIYNRKQTSGGYVIHIRHDNGFVSEYGHLLKDSQLVKEGYKVKKGQQIAKMGNSGMSLGNHLHFGLYKGEVINYNKNNWVNPFDYLCAYDNQIIGSTTSKKGYVKYNTKKVKGVPSEPLNIRNANNKIVGGYKNGDEAEYYGKNKTKAIVDNVRNYTTLDKYLK